MAHLVVRVDGAGPLAVDADQHCIDLRSEGGDRNVLIDPDQVVRAFLAEVSPRCRDLLRIAGAVYGADARVSRGTLSDVYNDAWRRSFTFHLRVHDLDFWTAPDVKRTLEDTLGFVSGDAMKFEFTRAATSPGAKQITLPVDLLSPSYRDANAIVLLSGGLDSLAATLQARAEGFRPLLVSHRPAPQIQSRQENLVGLLRARDPDWSYPHVSVLLHNVGERAVEFTQRTRSFVYAALAGIVSEHLNIGDVRLCDNGVVTLNLPPSGQSVGTTLSRSTHPGYLRRVQPLLRALTGNDHLTISNTLLGFTKREVVDVVARLGRPELVQETVSCAHTERMTRAQPHCGVCTQCIDRRFATIAAGVEEHDLVERYEKDIFTAPLTDWTHRAHAENYLRFTHELRRYERDPMEFFVVRGPDLAEALPEVDCEAAFESIHNLFQRHQQDVHAVLQKKIEQYAGALARAELPELCLLRMTGASDAKTTLHEIYIHKLAEILSDGLRQTFQTNEPANERAMQDAGEAVLHAAGERLAREAPQVPFGSVGVRPDFSKDFPRENALYIEFKLTKTKRDRNRTHAEIAQDLFQYPPGCHLLFVVFDSARAFADPTKIRDEVSRRANAMVVVVR